MCDNLDDDKIGELKNGDNKKKNMWQTWYSWKGIVKKLWKKEKRKLRDNLDDNKRKQVKESYKIRKKQMRDNLDNKKESWKILIAGEKEKNVTTMILMKRNS